jgi:hypothetical protein
MYGSGSGLLLPRLGTSTSRLVPLGFWCHLRFYERCSAMRQVHTYYPYMPVSVRVRGVLQSDGGISRSADALRLLPGVDAAPNA